MGWRTQAYSAPPATGTLGLSSPPPLISDVDVSVAWGGHWTEGKRPPTLSLPGWCADHVRACVVWYRHCVFAAPYGYPWLSSLWGVFPSLPSEARFCWLSWRLWCNYYITPVFKEKRRTRNPAGLYLRSARTDCRTSGNQGWKIEAKTVKKNFFNTLKKSKKSKC